MISKRLAAGILAVLTAITVARLVSTYGEFSDTYDEGAHIASGLEIYQFHRYTLDAQHPPAARIFLATLPYLFGHRLGGEGDIVHRWRQAIEKDGPAGSLISLARLGNLPFVALLIVFTYLFAADLYGRLAGLAAVALVTNSPNLLGHAGLATVDFGVAAALLAASYLLFRWARKPDRRRGLAAALGCALALTCKFSAVAFVPLTIAGYFAIVHRRRVLDRVNWRWMAARPAVLGGLKFAALTTVLVWAAFGFDFAPLREGAGEPSYRMKLLFPEGQPLSEWAYWFSEKVPVPLAGFAKGFINASAHARLGHGLYYRDKYNQYLLGELKPEGGWWYYFPVAIAVKSTIPFLLMLALGVGAIALGGRRFFDDGTLCIAASAAAILAVGMVSTINIGIRHILPVYPFLAILASSLFAGGRLGRPWQRGLRAAGFLLLAGHAVESARAHPDYFSYFNEIAAGREHEFLADSNLDWGQDMKRLARHAREHNTYPLQVAGTPPHWRINFWIPGAVQFGPAERPSGWVAVSINHIVGIQRFDGGGYGWLSAYSPRAKIGKSFWLYYLDPPAKAP
jgi:hypothetical protein